MMKLAPIKKYYIIPFIIIALIASLVACDKGDGKKQLLFHPNICMAI